MTGEVSGLIGIGWSFQLGIPELFSSTDTYAIDNDEATPGINPAANRH